MRSAYHRSLIFAEAAHGPRGEFDTTRSLSAMLTYLQSTQLWVDGRRPKHTGPGVSLVLNQRLLHVAAKVTTEEAIRPT
jgi:hypothetical protein